MNQPVVYAETRLILGIPARFESNAEEVIAAVRRAFAAWPVADAQPRVHVRFHVTESGGEGDSGAHIQYEIPVPTRVIFRSGHSLVEADAVERVATGRVTRAMLGNTELFRYGLLEAATLFLLTRLDRIPFHAAGLIRGDGALLLAGRSGAGKSTLAWAALRSDAGFGMLAEDCVYIQTEPESRVWGWPGFFHLSLEAAAFFDELRSHEPFIMASGKRKIALKARAITSSPVKGHWVGRATVCLIERSGGPPRLEPLDSQEAECLLFSAIEEGFDLFADRLPSAVRPFLIPHAWRLDPGPDPSMAVPLLLEALRVSQDQQPAARPS